MDGKTKLQRQILITACDHPGISQSEIATRVGCSPSYVSTVLQRYDGQDAMAARIEQLNVDLGFSPEDASQTLDDLENPATGEGISLEDLGPLGFAGVAVILGGFLLTSDTLLTARPTLRFGLVALCGVVVTGVGAVFTKKRIRMGSQKHSDGSFRVSPRPSQNRRLTRLLHRHHKH